VGSSEPPRVDPSPFDLHREGRSAALCLHGLTGTPYEVRPLGEALAKSGVRARGPALPGHNETPQALAAVPAEAWVEAARAELRELRARHEAVSVVGLSMGGLVALRLAFEEPVDALVVIGVPLRLAWWMRALLPVVRHVVPFVAKVGGSEIRDPEARRRHPSYPSTPLASVHALMGLQREVRRGLSRIAVPIRIAHGRHDRTANPADAREIYASVRSRARELALYEHSAHVVPVDHDGPRLAADTVDFVTRHASPGASRVAPR
jgi:carboxylesterase